MQNKKVVLISIIVLIGLFFAGGYFYKENKTEKLTKISKEQSAIFQRDYSIVIGPSDAKVQLVEFFDPACGTCAQFHFYVKDILKKNKDDIKLVLRYAPFHQNAVYAVKMLEGARAQNLFMPTLEFMFKTQAQWIDGHVVNPRKLWTLLPNVKGLDMEKLAKSMEDIMIDKIIEQDMKDVETLNIRKTPTYFVNGTKLEKFGLENLIKLIDSKL